MFKTMKARPFYPDKFNFIAENDSKGDSLKENWTVMIEKPEKKEPDRETKTKYNYDPHDCKNQPSC